LIYQRIMVANLPPFLGPRQSIPQCRQSLAAKRGLVQFLVRSNDDLALIDCGQRPAAQGDSVIANDVNAHGWVLLVGPAAVPPVTHTHALFADQSQSILDNLWHCWATAEHGIAQSKPRDLRVAE
jgi:hypothetical protein